MPMPLTLPNPGAVLVNLNINRVALCNEGCNSRADILLIKRKENTMPISFEDLMKALNAEQANTITAHIASIEEAHKTVVKGLEGEIAGLTGKVETLEKAKPAPAATDDILKDASPAIKDMFNKLQGTVNSLVAEREEDVAKSRFEKVKALPVEEAELRGILKSASPAVFAVLEKAANAVSECLTAKGKETGGQFPGTTAEDAYVVLEKSARAIMVEDSKLSFEQAFTKACERDAATYAKYSKGAK